MMSENSTAVPFNSPLEAGVRCLAILTASFPDALDLDRIIELDYLVVHSGDVNGPESLHSPLPMRAGELLVRRRLVEEGLLLMSSRGLIQRLPSIEGFIYIASESAAPFLSSLSSAYSIKLKNRAVWASERFSGVPTSEVRAMTHRLFEGWSSQFFHADPAGSSI